MQRAHGDSLSGTQIQLQTTEDHWQNIFAKYDRDRDGKIPVKEFAELLKESPHNQDVPSHVIRAILHRADTNQDSYITFQEFLKLIETPEGHALVHGWLNLYIRNAVVPRKRKKVVIHHDDIDGEYEDQYSCYPPAVCMLIVSIFEIAAYAWDYWYYSKTLETGTITGPVASLFIYNPYRRKEAWRFLSYMFVHIGVFHLLVNLVVQIMLGIPLEMVHGWWRVLTIYIAGVVAGSLGTSIADPTVYLAGASGGVYALITAHLATLIMNWAEMQFAIWQLLIFILLCSIDVGSAIYTRYVLEEKTQIGYVAHFGGAVAGFLVGLYILRNLEVRSWEKKIWWSALAIYFLLFFGTIVWNAAYPTYFPNQAV